MTISWLGLVGVQFMRMLESFEPLAEEDVRTLRVRHTQSPWKSAPRLARHRPPLHDLVCVGCPDAFCVCGGGVV